MEYCRKTRQDGVTYRVNQNDTLTVVEIDKNIEDLVIPEYVGGYPVVNAIIKNTMKAGARLKSIRLPRPFGYVGRRFYLPETFSGFEELETVDMSECESIDMIPPRTFACCQNLKTVKLPPNVKIIDMGAFEGCEKLTDISLPESVRAINEEAFFETNLKSLDSNAAISKKAFCNSSLKSIIVGGDGYEIIETSTFAYCRSLERVVIREGVRELSDGAFEGCKNLKEIVLPDSLKIIGYGAFAFCSKLESVDLKNVSVVDDSAFRSCSSLAYVRISNPSCIFKKSAFKGTELDF